MKKLLTLVAALTLLTACSGCTTVNKAAFKTTQAASVTADVGLSVWADYVSKQKAAGTPVPIANELAAKKAWNTFQDSRDGVINAGIAYSKAKEAGIDTTGVVAALNTAVAVMAASSADFLNLIQSFGVKL